METKRYRYINTGPHAAVRAYRQKTKKFFDCHACTRGPTLNLANSDLSAYFARHITPCTDVLRHQLEFKPQSDAVVSFHRFKK